MEKSMCADTSSRRKSYYLASAKEELQQTQTLENSQPQESDTAQDPRQQVRLPVLMYHSLLKDPAMQNSYVISPKLFEQDLKYLKKTRLYINPHV